VELENYQTKTGQTSISLLVENFPEAAEVALNLCVTHSPHLSATDLKYSVTYDFKYLDPGPEVKESSKRFSTVKTMIKNERERLLLHPLTLKFNERKWSTLGKFGFFGDFVTYFILLIFLSIFVVQVRKVTDVLPEMNTSGEPHIYYEEDSAFAESVLITDVPPEANKSGEPDIYYEFEEDSAFAKSVPIICSVFFILHLCKEFFLIYMQRWRYFKDTSNYLRWIFYLSSTIWPVADGDSLTILLAVATFVCYTNMMLFLRRYRLFGTYISMYTEVIKTVVQVMVVFVFLVLGFGLVFYILFQEQVKVIRKDKV